ncbi:MAG: DUF362 domain-containing protein [Bacteroidota bacterium]|jgi:uncharacterized protein (DUF362 family)|nr:DUF362 domain-containing protein [Ignavibacteria bacterium]MCU7499347.1 DUF362 domain-containing protein [Ignavibacteria bacterium]MCU7518951.1 DUF362 domain-containing protein [Ignavibacteria bacterium]MCU7525814.1 DUF362 domain-containing protein [Ignavibacteria bacterium]
MNRRKFFKLLTLGGLGTALSPVLLKDIFPKSVLLEKPLTNIADAMKYPRTEFSMPGRLPGKVVQVLHDKCIANNKIDFNAADEMLRQGILKLTGKSDIPSAWQMFVKKSDIIGLKVNPIGGALLSTSTEVVKSVINQLEEAGIPKKNIVIWDRRMPDLEQAGFTEANFPGVSIKATEFKDKQGSYYDANGKLYSEDMIDKNWYYWADVEEKYDAETIPYMTNEGKYSYFTKIVTQQVDKIINIPILKNAGASVTLAMKNLAFGSISNTSRLHKELWAETCAEVCAFPPLRDKVVLNIADGIKGCFQGGPEAKPQFFADYKTILFSTDPVALDRIGYEIVLKKRIEEKIQKADYPAARKYMDLAQNLGLGTAELERIQLEKITI